MQLRQGITKLRMDSGRDADIEAFCRAYIEAVVEQIADPGRQAICIKAAEKLCAETTSPDR